MVIKTYINKSNTLIHNSRLNTGLNPVAELFYGSKDNKPNYSRFLFSFDETKIKKMYDDKIFTDLSKLKHTLRMTNTGTFDKDLLNGDMNGKKRTTSFDLILFKINQEWDNGVGYDYEYTKYETGCNALSTTPSNWIHAKTGTPWNNGSGVYSGSPIDITIGRQHFDKGNENLEIDVTDFINAIITGETNNGLGLAFDRSYENLLTKETQYVGFFTNNTQTFYEPHIETVYSNHITDDRNDFYLDKYNKLYLYVNVGGNPINLDNLPMVNVCDNNGDMMSSYTNVIANHITKGVYSIDIIVPTTEDNIGTMYNDIWSNISINGVSRPNIIMDFIVKDSYEYYGLGMDDATPKRVGLSISGIKNNDKIKRGDIRKVLVSARIPYTINQTQKISDLKYRLYVREGVSEYTIIDYNPIEMTNNHYYFLLDTDSLLPNTYFIDIMVTSNLEITTIKESIRFDIINQVELRNR